MSERCKNAIDCDCCEGGGRYPIMSCGGKIRFWIECPACCGAGHDFGEAAEITAEERERQAELAFTQKYEAALAEMREFTPTTDRESEHG
jgi:DnaJ-class molecular chaperone